MAAEMIVRAGVGKITIVDADVIQSNINRQIIALSGNEGKPKVFEWKNAFWKSIQN